jgi:hypothetical protein
MIIVNKQDFSNWNNSANYPIAWFSCSTYVIKLLLFILLNCCKELITSVHILYVLNLSYIISKFLLRSYIFNCFLIDSVKLSVNTFWCLAMPQRLQQIYCKTVKFFQFDILWGQHGDLNSRDFLCKCLNRLKT